MAAVSLTDKKLKNFDVLVPMIIAESDRQIELWGIQRKTPYKWMTHCTEELGELAQAMTEHDVAYESNGAESVEALAFKEQCKIEAIQLATLALKIAEMYI